MIKTLFYNRTVTARLNTNYWVVGFTKIKYGFFTEIRIYFLCLLIDINILHKAKETK